MNNLAKMYQAGYTTISNLFFRYHKELAISMEEAFFIILLEAKLQRNPDFVDYQELADDLGIAIEKVYALLGNVNNKNLVELTMTEAENGQAKDSLSLVPLYLKLESLLSNNAKKEEQAKLKTEAIDLVSRFEQEFARPLSPTEIEYISDWVNEDHYSEELIIEALKQAVINSAFNFRYIDSVLISWEKKNIRSGNQARNESRRFARNQQQDENPVVPIPKEILLHNWLKDDKS